MKYQDKVRFADLAFAEIEGGKSLDEVSSVLSAHGLQAYDIDEVMRSSVRNVYVKYKEDLKQSILEPDSATNDKLDHLHEYYLNELQNTAKSDLATQLKSNVQKMLSSGMDADQIYDKVRLDIYPKERIDADVAQYQAEKQNKTKNQKWIDVGAIAMIAMSAYTILSESNIRPLYFTGIAGFILLIRNIRNKV